jgi:chromosome segregation ATPase
MEDERTGTEKPVEKYDIKKLDALAATLKTKNQCKISKLDKAQKAADCFKNQYDILEKDLAKVEEDFSEYQDKAQKYATALENNIEEETQRGKTLEGKIEKYQAALKPLQELYDQMNEPVNSTESGAGAINNISTFRAALNDLSTIKQNKITNAISPAILDACELRSHSCVE